MPELPDIEAYLHALRPRVLDHVIGRVRVRSPLLLRTFDPPVDACEGAAVRDVSRLGKRIVLHLEPPGGNGRRLFLVIHLMIAGRLRWFDPGVAPPSRITQATIEFPTGTLAITEAGTTHRAAMHVLPDRAALDAMNPGGLELLDPACSVAQLASALRAENHTLKRSLTDPRVVSGVGNAFSDEILHAARLSPVILTSRLTDEQVGCLLGAAREVLIRFRDLLVARFANTFPREGDITAFRPEFAVHGKFGQPCAVCTTAVQRIVRGEHETNYCPRCQTGGKLLADRSLSRLLRDDWPETIDELEELMPGHGTSSPKSGPIKRAKRSS